VATLPDGEKSLIRLAVSIEYRRVTDRQTGEQTDRQTSYDSIVRAMHSIAR